MTSASPHVTIAGGGVGALEAALALLDRAPGLPIELIAADSHFVNRPLSALEPFTAGSIRSVPLQRLADRGIAVRQARITAVDAAARSVATADGARHAYDALVVALGAKVVRPYDHALTFAGPRDAAALQRL